MPATEYPTSTVVPQTTLYDFLRILYRRKIWLLTAVLLALAAAVAYLAARPELFRSTVNLKIGQVGGAGLFEAPEVVAARLMSQYGGKRADGSQRERPFLLRASAHRSAPGVLILTGEAFQPGEVAAFLERLVEEVRTRHTEAYSRNVRSLEERLTRLETQRQELQRQYGESTRLLASPTGDLPVQEAFAAIDRGRIAATIAALDAEKPKLAQSLSLPGTQETTLLGEIQVPTRPDTPSKWLVAAAAALAGFLLGATAILVAEFAPRRNGASP